MKELRIRNETSSIRSKVQVKTEALSSTEPRCLQVSLDSRARDAFFAHYVSGPAKSWDVLMPYYNSITSPAHLTFSIDAVSLAYLSHEVSSDVALAASKQRYVSALKLTRKALKSPTIAASESTLLTSLMLDLYEKITNDTGLLSSWSNHFNGAFALIRLRGLEEFQDYSAFRILLRLIVNCIINCVITETAVPEELLVIRNHARKLQHFDDPKWRLTDLMVMHASLRSKISKGLLSDEECISQCLELDKSLQDLAATMPTTWHYEQYLVPHDSESVYGQSFDVYPERHITQVWNVIRLVRILLNEDIIQRCEQQSSDNRYLATICKSKETVPILAIEICSSAPQYLGVARMVPGSEIRPAYAPAQSYGSSESLDCYSLIFPLYIAARSLFVPVSLKAWTMSQLRLMGEKYGIRKAYDVLTIIEQQIDVKPWTIYIMLGGYAFAA